jgi:Ca-activated chloride channel family protein
MRSIAIVCAALMVAACQEAPPPAPPPKPVAKAAPVPPASGATAAPASSAPSRLRTAWPPAKDEAVAVAPDLFAKNYYIVLDASGSMNEKGCSGENSKMRAAKEALATFVDALPPDANLGLVVFDGRGINEWLPIGTNNRPEFRRLLDTVRANASTPLRAAITLAYGKLTAQGARQLGYGEYHMVVVTDGHADQGQDPTAIVNKVLAESPVVLQVIGFCIGAKHALNQAGRTMYKEANNVEDLRQGLADVLAEAPQFTVTEFKK